MKVAVIGTGYVGLVAGACLADTGNEVSCVDVDAGKVEMLRRGEVPIYEPGLTELVKKNAGAGRLTFTIDLAQAVGPAEVVFIAVGTPSGSDGSADLSAVLAVAEKLAPLIEHYKLVVLKSTVPVGTHARVKKTIAAKAKGPFDVANNPEFMKEGAALEDFQKPDRVVVGADAERARSLLQELYEPFLRSGKPILFMDPPSAEMTKYAANALLATKISFMNEVAALCEASGADVEAVRRGIGSDARIGFQFIYPGLGYGGSCFPKDVRALAQLGEEKGVSMPLANAVDTINRAGRLRFARRVLGRLAPAKGKRAAVWGLSFKPKTDDVREAPALAIIEELLAAGVRVTAWDPVAVESARRILKDRVSFAPGPYEAAEGADVLILATEWNEFRNPDFERLKGRMAQPLVFDGRNAWDPSRMAAMGFEYHCVGRPSTGVNR